MQRDIESRRVELLARLRLSRPLPAAIHPTWQVRLLPEFDAYPALRERLAATPRLQSRLGRLLAKRAGIVADPPPPAETEGMALATASLDELARLMRLTGGIWHGASVAKLVLRDEVAAIVEQLTPPVFEVIHAHRRFWTAPGEHLDVDELMARIVRDGRRCVASWLATLPEVLARCVLLKIEPADGIARPWPSPAAEHACRLIAAVAPLAQSGRADGAGP